jgi:predicted phosphohydrolase
MRIAYMSDLHLEFEPPRPSSSGWEALRRAREALPGHPNRGPLLKSLSGSDLVILAGDIDLGLKAIAYGEQVASFVGCPVIMVAGNHEYYGHDFDRLGQKMRHAAWETQGRVIFLERDSVRLLPGGHPLVIHGCTLWTDYGLNAAPEVDMALAQLFMNDHRRISRDFGWFSPEHAREEHRLSLDWLQAALSAAEPEGQGLEPAKRLVVTHHAPLRTKLQGHGDGAEAAYMSDLEGVIARLAPDAWLHGHTHHRHVTPIGRTIVASAPRGYPGREPGALGSSFGFLQL